MEHDKSSGQYVLAISIVASALILSGVIWVSANGVSNNVAALKGAISSIQINTGGTAGAGTGGTGNQGTGNTGGTQQQAGPKTFDLVGAPMKGSANAKVTIVEFTDFQCPFCRRFYEDAYPQVIKDYVDTGKAKIYFKQFPLAQIHPQAEISAEASECAKDQGKFWEMHDKMFNEEQKIEPSGNTATFSATDLKKWAVDIGLDAAKFNTCLDSGSKAATVQAQENEGIAAGVSGTPTFYINGQQLVGAQPFSAFKSAIDQAIAAG